MQKIVLAFSLFLFVASGLFAQRVSGGILGGVAATQVAGDAISGFDKAGVVAGVWARVPLKEKTAFQMELAYFQKGSRQNPDEENDFQQVLMRLQYIDLPFLFQYVQSPKLRFETGLSYGVLIAHHAEANYSTDVGGTEFNTSALNFVGGMYYSISEKMSMNLRSVNSILPVRDHVSGAKWFNNRGQYNLAIVLGVYYQL